MRARTAVCLLAAGVTLAAAEAHARSVRVTATAYCLTSLTATGARPYYGTVAVDPRYIPLGTRMYVSGYGRARALDTGAAIKGWRIDVWFPSCAQAWSWGVRRVTVTM